MNDSTEARETLARLKNEAFGGDEDALALALNRPVEEIRLFFQGGAIDEDTREKINGIAQQRLSE